MNIMNSMHRARAVAVAAFGILLALPLQARAQTQAAVITGKVTTEFGQPVDQANVYIQELAKSVGTNAQGVYTITVEGARVSGQEVNLRVRAIGYQPGLRPIRVTAGNQTQDFSLKQDINRLNEVVVTGVVGEGVERSKVPFSISRLTNEDLPVPALDPVQALSGKVAGMRVGATGGKPGSTPEIMLRGPKSINAQGRSQQPLFVVDGTVLNVGSYDELGALDIESVEVVKGAAGASIYGATAANGVIVIKTKRGLNQDGVKFNARTEYGFSDLNSFDYGMPLNHSMQLDETGTRFCVGGSGATAPCTRTVDWMSEVLRINSVKADTTRTGFGIQFGQPGGADLMNVFQANIWPGQYYNTMAEMSTPGILAVHSLDATGRAGNVRYFASGSYSDDQGGVRGLNGEQQRRGRVNLDYDLRSNASVQISTMYDRGTNDLHNANFGGLLRGATPGTNYLARDSIGRALLIGFGPTSRPTGNGQGGYFYGAENEPNYRVSDRFMGSLTSSYFPAEWVTLDGTVAYDVRSQVDRDFVTKGFRTTSINVATNLGNASIGNRREEAINTALGGTLRHQFTSDISGRLQVRGTYEQDVLNTSNGGGEQFIVKDIFTLSNTSTNKTATSGGQTIKRIGSFVGANVDIKGRYILDGTFRYDGSSLFGEGNRWAPFGRQSIVWRVSEEPFWHVPHISDFRIRASNGTAGNSPSFAAQYETYNCSATGCSLGQAGNPKLKPETTREIETGTDFTLFDRLGIELTHVNSTTKNQILPVPTAASLGFSSQWQNAGTLQSKTWELAANLPVISRRDFSWSMRGTWDRTRTYITELFQPDFFMSGGTTQGTGSFFFVTANPANVEGFQLNQFGNILGRKFYKTCGDMPASIQGQCGDGKAYQVNDKGWVVWVGEGNSWRDGITKNLWQTKLPAAQSPWNVPLQFGHPIVDRPLRGTACSATIPENTVPCPGETVGALHILGNTLPDFRLTWANTVQFKRLTAYALIDGTYGNFINNQGEQWGLLDFSSSNFDQANNSVETAKPVGYGWRVGAPESGGSGGFYDVLGPNNYSVEKGTFTKVREVSLTYRLGAIRGIGGDWTAGVIGRNLFTLTNYTGYDPETGVSGGPSGSGLINGSDAFDFPTLRRFTFTLSTRF
ncbi:MAG TPA: TonB-dependent receptor [Vicinamibacterales bacterium]|jgi:TonB-linked SusC/RagA family outer membrane protein